MTAENDMPMRIWPATGILGASYRIMFPLTAIWAVTSIVLWHGGFIKYTSMSPAVWHMHEMTFGLGGAALLGYLPSACSSWTGRAPISGQPILLLAVLWIASRFAMYFSANTSPVLLVLINAAVFWTLAAVLAREVSRGAKRKASLFVGFSVLAGAMSAMCAVETRLGVFACYTMFPTLVMVVGGRMAFGFLQSQALLNGDTSSRDPAWPVWVTVLGGALFLGSHVLESDIAATLSLAVVAISLWCRFLSWPLKYSCAEPLVFMAVLGFLWIVLSGTLFFLDEIQGQSVHVSSAHALYMGAICSLIMAIIARPYAHRTKRGLRARKLMLPAFLVLQVSITLRIFDQLDAAVLAWAVSWGLFLLSLRHRLSGPIPRPIFSGTRMPSTH